MLIGKMVNKLTWLTFHVDRGNGKQIDVADLGNSTDSLQFPIIPQAGVLDNSLFLIAQKSAGRP